MMSCGKVWLPSDFDIFRPFSSSVKPCVSTTSNGARPRVPQLSSSDDWNQPRCWSEPSRYITVSSPPSTLRLMPARPGKCTGSSSTNACVEPESNQTSQISSTFFHSSLASEPRKRSRAPSTYQASAPSCSNASAMRWLTASSSRISAEPSPFSRTNTAIGTPQARWREITQSGLLLIMPLMRFSPDCGTHWVTEIACSARLRRVSPDFALPSSAIGLSIAMNHCGVLRKITGFFERQECGYWCLRRPRPISMPASIKALITASLASPLSPFSVSTRLPVKPGACSVKRPSSSTVYGIAVLIPRAVSLAAFAVQTSKSSRPCPGAVCTNPVPASSVTWSPTNSGTSKLYPALNDLSGWPQT